MLSEVNLMQSDQKSPALAQEAGLPTPPSRSRTVPPQRNIEKIKKLLEEFDNVLVLVPNSLGEVQALASPNVRQHKWAILKDAHQAYNQILREKNDACENQPVSASLQRINNHKQKKADVETCPKISRDRGVRKKSTQCLELEPNPREGSVSYGQRPPKRRRSGPSNAASRIPPRPTRASRSRLLSTVAAPLSLDPASQIRVEDTQRLEQWFREAFLTMQQVACRLVAKVWIKKIHPKKQSTHPYNGGMPRDQPPDSNRTRPPYWPQNVIHREPDHIGRDDRINLLVHLILNTPQKIITNPPSEAGLAQYLTAQDLCDCLEEKKDDLQEFEWEILQNVVRTREMMEQYEDGQIDGDSLVFCHDYSVRSRNVQSDTDESVDELGTTDLMGDEAFEDSVLTPVSSALPSPGARIGVDDVLQISGPRRSTTLENTSVNLPIAHCSRPGGKVGQVSSSLMVPHTYQDPPLEMSARMSEFECHIDHQSQDTLMHDTRTGLSRMQPPGSTMIETKPQMTPRLTVATSSFDRDYNSIAHSTTATDPQHAHGMMRGLSNSISSQGNIYTTWSGSIHDMGADSVDGMYGLNSHLVLQQQDMRTPYFTQSPQGYNVNIQSDLTMLDPARYQGVTTGTRRDLPVREVTLPHSGHLGLIAESPHEMDMLHGAYYQL